LLAISEENLKITKNESSNTIDLIDLEERPNRNVITEEDVSINEEKRINTIDIFENLQIRQPAKIEEKPEMVMVDEKNNSSPKKFYKDGSTMLDNEFFKNYLGETNSIQKSYCKDIIDSLLNVNRISCLVTFG
jgi:hypothetical protein